MVRLAALAVAVQTLADRVAQLERQHHRGRVDPAADAKLLSSIAATFGGAVFSAVDLQASTSPELRSAIGAATTRALGAWLKRLRAHPADPYRLRRVKRDGDGMLWTLDVSS